MQDYYTINETTEKLKASRTSVYRWIREGKLEANRTATGKTLISEAALLAFIGEKPAKDKEPAEK